MNPFNKKLEFMTSVNFVSITNYITFTVTVRYTIMTQGMLNYIIRGMREPLMPQI